MPFVETTTTKRALTPAEAALVAENRGLVLWYVNWTIRKYSELWYYRDDMIGGGMLGLIEAAKRYKPEVGKFSTYAIWWIRRYVREEYRAIGVARYSKNMATATNWNDRVCLDEFDDNTQDMLVGFEDAKAVEELQVEDHQALVQELLRHLTPFEAWVLKKRFGLDDFGEKRTLQEVGRLCSLSRERIRQIEAEIFTKLRAERWRQLYDSTGDIR